MVCAGISDFQSIYSNCFLPSKTLKSSGRVGHTMCYEVFYLFQDPLVTLKKVQPTEWKAIPTNPPNQNRPSCLQRYSVCRSLPDLPFYRNW